MLLPSEEVSSGAVLHASEQKRLEALERIERAKAYQAEDDLDGAQAEVTNAWYALDEALKICPQNHRARFLLVSCSMNAEDFHRAKTEALVIYNDLTKEQLLQMSDSVLHLSIAHAAKMCNEVDEAIRFATEATNLYPTDPQPYMVLGECLHETNRMVEAEKSCRQSLSHNEAPGCKHPLNPQNLYFTLCCLAACLVSQDKYSEAEPYVHKAMKVDSGSATAWQHLLDIYKGQGRKAEALEVAQRLVDLDPSDSEAASALARLQCTTPDNGSDKNMRQREPASSAPAAPRRQHGQPSYAIPPADDHLEPGGYGEQKPYDHRAEAAAKEREDQYDNKNDCMDGWSKFTCCVFD